MNDRELLEMAAKAVDLRGFIQEWVNGPYFVVAANPNVPRSEPKTYDWLNDDGDALRLAAKLKIDIEWQATNPFPEARVEAYQRNDEGSYFCADEPEDNYRRAIVRAAAEIGKAMP